jgi:hypothetical protein
MSRVVFLVPLLLLLGCGTSQPSSKPTESASETPAIAPMPKPVEEPYQLDPARHVISNSPVSGRLAGQVFKPEHVIFRGNALTFRTGTDVIPDREVTIQFQTASDQSVLPIRVQVNPIKPAIGSELARISVGRKLEKESLPVNSEYPDKYSMTLELSSRLNGLVKGQIYLALPDAEKSYLTGSFEATWMRSFGGPLDMDEVPYVQGSFTLPAKMEMVKYGYLGEGAMGSVVQCTSSINIKELGEGARIGSSSGDVLGRGDIYGRQEKGEVKFDSSRLTPGRYLFWAKTNSGAMAFEWADIAATSQATVKLQFPSTTGGIEARVPAAFQGKIDVTPVDPKEQDAKKEFAGGRFNPLQTDAIVKEGKATVLNLPPGKYRFRMWRKLDETSWSGGDGFFVDVKPGAPAIINVEPKK